MRQILKNKLNIKLAPLVVAFAVSFASVAPQTVQAQSATQTVTCSTIQAFATASERAMIASQNTMQSSFQVALTALQATWRLQDQVNTALRQVSESAFRSLLRAYRSLPLVTSTQREAVDIYEETIMNAVRVLYTNIDAATAAYREDMLALIRSHHHSLTELVQASVDKIHAGLEVAKDECYETGTVRTLVGVIASANLSLLRSSTNLTLQNLGKAVGIANTRNRIFIEQHRDFLSIATRATVRLINATLTNRL